MPQREKLWILVIPLLLTIYCLPIYALLIDFLIFNYEKNGPGGAFRFAVAMANSQSDTLNLFHKILFPMIAGISAFLLSKKNLLWWSQYVTIGLVVSLAVVIFLSISFSDQVLQRRMEAFDTAVPSPAVWPALTGFFNRVIEMLATYLMLIIGLESAKQE
jgi:hypothetical protein